MLVLPTGLDLPLFPSIAMLVLAQVVDPYLTLVRRPSITAISAVVGVARPLTMVVLDLHRLAIPAVEQPITQVEDPSTIPAEMLGLAVVIACLQAVAPILVTVSQAVALELLMLVVPVVRAAL